VSASSQAPAWEFGAGSWSFVVWVPKLELGNQRINDIVPRSGVEYILHTSALLNATPERRKLYSHAGAWER